MSWNRLLKSVMKNGFFCFYVPCLFTCKEVDGCSQIAPYVNTDEGFV